MLIFRIMENLIFISWLKRSSFCFIRSFIYYIYVRELTHKNSEAIFLMNSRMQKTFLYKSSSKIVERLANWAINPWRRYSLLAIIFLIGFLIGSSLGMINGVLALMDPVGAFIALIFLEILVKARFVFLKSKQPVILVRVFDMFRIGLAYGLFSEGLKLL